MTTALHKNLPVVEIHCPISFEYADAAARTGATGLTADDVRKFARQLDNNTLWMLTNHSPVTWTEITSSGGVPTSRQISTQNGLQGGGNLSADRTLSPVYGSTANTVCQGNDSRLSDARTPLAHKSSHVSGGDAFLSTDVLEAIAKRLQETGGPTTLLVGAVADGQFLKRSGTGIVGDTPAATGAKLLNGFVDRVNSTLGMSGSTFQITTGTSYDFYSNGNKYTKTTTQQVSIATDQTLHFVYFDSSGVLQVSTTPWDIIANTVPVATVYKDGSNYVITDERHGWIRDRDWHKWAHETIGARYVSGFAGTFGNSTFSVAQGVVADEDIFFDTGGAKTNCQLWYRNSGLTSMRVELGVTTPYKAASGVIQYDNAGTLTNVSANSYVNSYVYATNVAAYPIIIVVGHNQYVNLSGARNEAIPTPLVPTAEWKLLYRATYRNVGGTPTFIEATDLRTTTTGPAYAPPAPATPVFGQDYQSVVDESDTTTTSSAGVSKVQLTAPTLTGTFKIQFSCEVQINSSTIRSWVKLINRTDMIELNYSEQRQGVANIWLAISGFAFITLTNEGKGFNLMFGNSDNATTTGCRRARVEFWRVS